MSKQPNNSVIKTLIIFFVIFFVSVATYEYVQYGSIFNNTEYFRKIYANALVQKNDENYTAAFKTLEKISPRYEAFDAVLYLQSQCAAKAGDEATAQKRLKSLISKYPQSFLYIPAKYDLAKSYLRSGNKSAATTTFQNIINSHANTDFETGSYYYLADMSQEKDVATAVKYRKRYIEKSQNGRFSIDCAKNLIASKASLTKEDNLHIALVFFNAQKYDDAMPYFFKSPETKSWYYLAKINIFKKNYANAKGYIIKGLSKYSGNFTDEEISDIMYEYAGMSTSPQLAWEELNKITKQEKYKDIILYNLAKYMPQDKAYNIYRLISENHLKGDYAADALKKLFWYEYENKNYKVAKTYAIKHVSSFSSAKSSSEMHYWLGKIYEAEKNKDAALKIYNKILQKYPDDYYALRAFARINYIKKGRDFGWNLKNSKTLHEEKFELEMPYTYSEIKTKFGATLAELLMVEDFTTIEYFYDFKEPFIESWIYYKKGLHSTSTTTARNAMEKLSEKPDRTDIKWKFVYPCYYAKEINKYAQRNNISPYILISLIREESYFNPLALSGSNAIGLTQILPSTAKEVAERKGYGTINEFLLFNPETNIKYGAAYYSQIKKQVKNNDVFAIASYNGGAGAVSGWLKKTNKTDIDEFIENIPYPETQNYIKKVYRSYWNYVRLYENQL